MLSRQPIVCGTTHSLIPHRGNEVKVSGLFDSAVEAAKAYDEAAVR